MDFGTAEISFIIISKNADFVKQNLLIFLRNFWQYFFRVKTMKMMRKPMIFLTGGASYVGIELLWRVWSHGSMFLAGGACLLLVGHLEEVEPKLPFPLRVLTGAAVITMVELGTGLVFNRDFRVWDYRGAWGNWLGQICPAFCLAWLPLSALAGKTYLWLDRKLEIK